MLDRRSLLKVAGGTLALPMMESITSAAMPVASASKTPTCLLIVGNPFDAHPEHFFPDEFGKDFVSRRHSTLWDG